MGVISEVEKRKETGPECPVIFTGVMETYRAIKFVQREHNGSLKLYSRDMLTWQDLDAYQRVSGQRLTMLESELIMGIEGIFEGKDDG